jgi:hypothetical protein
MDEFKDIFDNTVADNDPAARKAANAEGDNGKLAGKDNPKKPTGNAAADDDDDFDPVKDTPDMKTLKEHLKGKLSFFSKEKQVELAKVMKEGDAAGFSEIMEDVMGSAVASAASMSMRGSAQSLKSSASKLSAKSSKSAQSSIRQNQLAGSLYQKYPNLKQSGTKDMVENAVSKFSEKMSDKSDEEIVAKASRWVEQTFNVDPIKSTKKAKSEDDDDSAGETDWLSI